MKFEKHDNNNYLYNEHKKIFSIRTQLNFQYNSVDVDHMHTSLSENCAP